MCSRVTLDGNVIEECVNAGDGKFKEGAWVKISEDYENHPERQQLAKFVGKYGRLTRRYHGCVAVLRGRLPVTVQLLSPAGRPAAITQDLAGFWNGAYKDVRRDLRGRYPRHPWPEDPANAQATALTKKRLEQQQR